MRARLLRHAPTLACAWLAATASAAPQQALLDDLGDVRLAARALRALRQLDEADAVARLVEAAAATANSQAGLVARRRAAAALEELAAARAPSGATVDGLVDALEDTEDARRIEALLAALGALVPHTRDARSADRALAVAEEHALRLWHADEQRWTAGEPSTPLIEGYRALARMQVAADTPRERLEELLRGPDALVRECAAERLAAHGEAALPALHGALRDAHPDVTRGARIHVAVPGPRLVPLAAARSIARIDARDPDAVEGLIWFAKHGLGHQRLAAVTALGDPAPGQPSTGRSAARQRWRVVHVLIVIARAADDRLAIEAITALGRLGASARPALGTLEQLAADEREDRSAAARAALRQIRGS